jgi:serine/threonine-protein kinase
VVGSTRSAGAPPADETLAGDEEATDAGWTRPEEIAEAMVVGGRYRLERRLGAGGMGEVWQACHVDIGIRVAIKLLAPQLPSADMGADRFLREAQVLASIAHPNIVQVTDFGRTDRGTPYFVMEAVAGRSLHELIRSEAPLPWPRARHLLVQLAEALAAAHAHGVVHRDVKPSNVLVTRDGEGVERIKVIDFGIAKSVELDEKLRKLTRTGVVFGSPAYMSPEQATGAPIDGRSDVYSFGCVAYEMLAGRGPFDATTAYEHLYCRLYTDVDEVRAADVPPAFAAVVLGCLRRDLTLRTAGMEQVREALLAIDGSRPRATELAQHVPVATETSRKPVATLPALPPGEAASAVTAPLEAAAPTAVRRRRWPWLVAAGVLGFFGAGVGAWAWSSHRDDGEVRDDRAVPAAVEPRADDDLDVAPEVVASEVVEPPPQETETETESETGGTTGTTGAAESSASDGPADEPVGRAPKEPRLPRRHLRPTPAAGPAPTPPVKPPPRTDNGTFDVFGKKPAAPKD